MKYVNLGPTGLKVSGICLGTMSYGDPAKGWNSWILPPAEGERFVRQALDLGINFFDVADVYAGGSSEEFLGEALAAHARRDEVVIATKVGGKVDARSLAEVRSGWPTTFGLSRKHICDAIDASLRRLKTDYIDLYQIHSDDLDIPIEEIVDTLDGLVRAGKIRHFGASNISAWRLAKGLFGTRSHAAAGFVSVQHHYNLLYREHERELLPLIADQGLASLPWSPLARGYLSGGRSRESGGSTPRAVSDPIVARLYGSDADYAIIDSVKAVAQARGVSPSQVALAWLTSRPGTTVPVIGATQPNHLSEAVEALSLDLTAEEIAAVEKPYQTRAVANPR